MLVAAIFVIVYNNAVDSGSIFSTNVREKNNWDNSVNVNLQNTNSILALLVFVFGIAGISGLHILGSGLSVFTQKLIFNSGLFGGIWAALSINNSLVLFKDPWSMGEIFWSFLTIIYVLGIGVEIDMSTIGN